MRAWFPARSMPSGGGIGYAVVIWYKVPSDVDEADAEAMKAALKFAAGEYATEISVRAAEIVSKGVSRCGTSASS